jgi:hypothetical protein
MPAGMAKTPSDSPVGQQKKGANSNVAQVPFARASKWHLEQSNTQSGIALSTNPQVFNYPIASYGYLSAIFITVQLTGALGGSSMTYFEDAPYSLLSQIQLSDVNGVPIFQLSGFHAYLAAKYGGYRPFSIDGVLKGAPFDSPTTAFIGTPNQVTGGQSIGTGPGAGAGGGPLAAVNSQTNAVYSYGSYFSPPIPGAGGMNTKFIIPIWLEFGTDGLGCLPNMDASARYNLQLTVAGGANTSQVTGPYVVGGTICTTLPTMAITIEILARSQPPAQDMFGNMNSVAPPAVGTVQYWTNQTASGLANGSNTIQLTRVGNLIRNHILVWRSSTTTLNPRAGAELADMPSLFEFDWDTGQRYVCNVSTLRAMNGYYSFGYDMPNGVVLLPNTLDPDKLPFSEYGDEWMGTVGATKLTLRFSPGASASAGSVSILTNDIVPASGQIYQAPSLALG